LLGLVPGQRLERAVRARERLRYAVRVVQAVQRGLASRAQAPVRNRRERVALRLDRAALARADVHPAAGRALAARGAEPRGEAGDHVFRRDHVRQQPLGGLRRDAEQPGARAGGTNLLEELTAFHAHWSAPRRRSRRSTAVSAPASARAQGAAAAARRASVVADKAVNADITLLVAVDAPPHPERRYLLH